MADIIKIKALLKETPDFPQKGVIFRDIFPLFQDPLIVQMLVTNIVHHILSSNFPKVDVIVGLDARGFLLGPWIANQLGCAFVPVRKSGKLPGATTRIAYKKEYGTDYFEMHNDSIKAGQNAIVLDDLLATGGSAKCAGDLIKLQGGNTISYIFIIELLALKGAPKLDAPVYSLVKYEN